MNKLTVSAFGAIFIALFFLVLFLGLRFISLFVGVSPAFAQVINALTPKIVQTQTQVIIFENPLVDEAGMSVEEVQRRRNELLGQEVIIKGEIGRVENPWGFWLKETNDGRDEVFIVTNDRIANQDVANFDLTGRKYLRIKGVVKEMGWTNQDSITDVIDDEGTLNGRNERLAIVANQITGITVAE